MARSCLRGFVFVLPLFLGACGDGWEAQKTTNYAPYGNSRTAGSGVIYVRAQLLPEKDLKLEPELTRPSREEELGAQPVQEVKEEQAKPALDAEKIFSEAQVKGAASKQADDEPKEEDHGFNDLEEYEDHAVLSEEEVLLKQHEASFGNRMALKDRAGEVSPAADVPVPVEAPAVEVEAPVVEEDVAMEMHGDEEAHDVSGDSHEEEKIGFREGNVVTDISPEAGDALDDVVEVERFEARFSERTISQPVKQIIVPKRDAASMLSIGQETLDEIYSSPF